MAGSQVLAKNEKRSKKMVYYTGSDTLKAGYALCYDRDTITAEDGSGTALAASSSSWGRHAWVEKPASGNLHNFAGIVDDTPDKAGPCWVSIIEPDSIPRSMQVYTEENCTANSTVLTLKPDDYELGGLGEGLVIGKALQTVDRSSTAGLVQALIRSPDIFRDKTYGDAVPSSTNNVPSYAIWETCPWNEMLADPSLGYAYFEDYLGPLDNTDDDGFAITATTSGALTPHTDAGGSLLVDSAGNASADDGIEAQVLGVRWKPAAGKKLWFEARVRMTDIDTTPDQFYLGLASIDTSLIASGVIDDVASKVGFFTDDGTTAGQMEFIASKGASEEIQTDAATGLVDATWVNLGFVIDGVTSITPYVNGVAGTALTDTDDIPIVAMTLSYVAKCEQTAADAEMSVDWVRIAQLR